MDPRDKQRVDRRQFVTAAMAPALGAAFAASTTSSDLTPAESKPKDPQTRIRLHVVGNGCPQPTATHFGSSFILEVDSHCIMIDCGPATTYKITQMGIRPRMVSHLFFTHHHFDHNADFPCFALTRWDMSDGRQPPLKVYGPPPTGRFVERLLGEDGAFFDDWNSRIEHPVSQQIFQRRGGVLPRPAPTIEAEDIGPERVVESDSWTVKVARVHHVEPTLTSLAYRVETEHGSIVFAGDCGDCDALRAIARQADTLVIACVYIGRSTRYSDIITGTGEAADIARASGVRRVILSHAAPGFSKPDMKKKAIADVARIHDGIVLFPDELTTVDL